MRKVYRPQRGIRVDFPKNFLGGLGGIRIFDDAMQKIGFFCFNLTKLRLNLVELS